MLAALRVEGEQALCWVLIPGQWKPVVPVNKHSGLPAPPKPFLFPSSGSDYTENPSSAAGSAPPVLAASPCLPIAPAKQEVAVPLLRYCRWKEAEPGKTPFPRYSSLGNCAGQATAVLQLRTAVPDSALGAYPFHNVNFGNPTIPAARTGSLAAAPHLLL